MEHDMSNPSRLVHRHLYPISLKLHALALSDHICRSARSVHVCQCHTAPYQVNFLKKHKQPWLQTYMELQKEECGYDNFLKLLQCFCARYGHTHQQASFAKQTVTDLESTRTDFAARLYNENDGVPDECVYNVDETDIQYDMPPRYIWSQRDGTTKLSKGEKHSQSQAQTHERPTTPLSAKETAKAHQLVLDCMYLVFGEQDTATLLGGLSPENQARLVEGIGRLVDQAVTAAVTPLTALNAALESQLSIMAAHGRTFEESLARSATEVERLTYALHTSEQQSPSRLKPIKLEVTKFGGAESDKLLRWILQVETAANAQRILDDDTRVAFAMSHLKGLHVPAPQ
ncbi:hypothetical protein H257_07293 [Aphanomyces astaci]|uniref:Retrotransposon gag domain-containing protein n=1 Tax=Aphanomyces astaci TaxID=112090 RepID=W4GIT4_APHAT|nr:hypothetical protein H257_07293 [Aphanomyces astaci]ETV79226.1 hypothetical protein H257_07293 [Aphanomyces astaci]|eukprot:XP_009831067.1 hypothetical protein H257_07293 [Aphanomyces astaci]